MITPVIFLVLLISLTQQLSPKVEWNRFLRKYKIKIVPGEEKMRYDLFVKALEYVETVNSQNLGYKVEINMFSHLRNHEIPLMKIPKEHMEEFEEIRKNQVDNELVSQPTAIPDSIDWRTHNVVTGVLNQGRCGSCWAFSAAGVVESQYALGGGHLTHLSPQQILDCNPQHYSCRGGVPINALRYVQSKGLEALSQYPYITRKKECEYEEDKAFAHIKDTSLVIPWGNEEALTKAIAIHGPVSVCIYANQPSFYWYSSGVHYSPHCGHGYDHAVIAVGYGATEDGTKYYIVKNSWGYWWGDKGYVLMARDRDNNCQIASFASTAKYTKND